MDATAISLCMDNKLPIVVFNLRTAGNCSARSWASQSARLLARLTRRKRENYGRQ